MYLKALHLIRFRNLADVSLSLHPHLNVLVGNNAQGKTNIIEAIHLLSFGKSFRVQDYKDLMAWGEKECFIRSWVFNEIGEEERNIHLTAEKKQFYKNAKPVSPNQFLTLPLVLFAPESILLLKESPQGRREYIDDLISVCLPPYAKHLRDYKRALAQRNKLLKDEFLSREEKQKQMELWEAPMREQGSIIIEERKRWLGNFNLFLEKHYAAVAGLEKGASFVYRPNVEAEAFALRQQSLREEELDRGVSLVGPHRDDFVPSLNQQPIKNFGSQGELRTFTLALKLAEIEFLEETLSFSPLLLLDDVVSELDEKRNAFFFKHLENFKGQIFATATALNLFPKSSLKEYLCWELQEGKVKAF